MAPGWVRISQLHMKEERQRVGKLSAGVRFFLGVFFLEMMKGREPSCFDYGTPVLLGASDEQPYALRVAEVAMDFQTALFSDPQRTEE